MAAIVAVWDRDGDVNDGALACVQEPLSYRGVGSWDRVVTDMVALGYTGRRTTGSEGEQPLFRDGVGILFDGRIDNRNELTRSIEAASDDDSDPQLLAKGYRQRGIGILRIVVGVFALVVWDASKRRLFCARDRTGVRHLYFGSTDQQTVIASEASAVARHPDVEATPNDFLAVRHLAGRPLDRSTSFFDGVERIDPGSYVAFSEGGRKRARYWRPPATVGRTETVPERRLRTAIEKAVEARLATPDGAAGTMMSGGIDSTAVAAIAQALLRSRRTNASHRTYSAVFEEFDDVDESSGIAAVEQLHGIDSNRLEYSDGRILPDETDPALRNDPCYDSCYGMVRRLAEVASGDVSVLLTGIGGNLHDGSLLAYTDLADRGRWRRFFRDARSESRHWWQYLLVYGVLLRAISTGPSFYDEIVHPGRDTDWLARSATDGCTNRLPEPYEQFTTHSNELLSRKFASVEMDYARDGLRQQTLAAGVELRHPLLDVRVIEALFESPVGIRRSRGRSKHLFRRAVGEYLPESVLQQSISRNGYGAVLDDSMRAWTPDRSVQNWEVVARGYVRPDELRSLLAASDRSGADENTGRWNVVTTERWLRRSPG